MDPHRPLCELESLETRRLFTTLTYTANVPGGVATMAGYSTVGVALPGGKLLACGYSPTGSKHQNLYVMYNADGSPDQSFGQHGYAIQSPDRSVKIGIIDAGYALSDGSVLLQFETGLRRLSSTGVFDAGFGTNGLYKAYLNSAVPQANGTLIGYGFSSTNKPIATRFNPHGKVLGMAAAVNYATAIAGSATGLMARFDQNDSTSNHYDTLKVFNSDGSRDTTFGVNGSVNLQPIEAAWIKRYPSWYATNGTKIDGSSPYLFLPQSVTAASDGGLIVDAIVLGAYTYPQPRLTTDAMTHLHMRFSSSGKLISINHGADDRLQAAFYAGDAPTFGGTFHYGNGSDQTFILPNRKGWINSAIRATDGGYFLLGAVSPDWDGKSNNFTTHMMVVHVKASGSIAGTLFNDHDRDGLFDAGESTNAGRTVFIDANNNGLLDPGENVTTTDADGFYSFGDVQAGQYVVRRVLPKGFKATTATRVMVVAGQVSTLNIGSMATA